MGRVILDESARHCVIASDPTNRDLEGFFGRETEPQQVACLDAQLYFELINFGSRKRSMPFHVGSPPRDCIFKHGFVQDPDPGELDVP